MTSEDFSLHYHELKLEIALLSRTGLSFQDLFEQIMKKHDPSFLTVKPMGREGDWKCDGFSLNSGTVFQCYAPETLTGAEAARKVREDFHGAYEQWQEKMLSWIFVWSSDRALPPQVVNILADLRSHHPHVKIDHMGRQGLWLIVSQLPLLDRIAILGPVPALSDVPATTAAEIQVLLRHLDRQTGILPDPSDFDLTAISEKLTRNRLSGFVTMTLRPALPVAHLVREYVTRTPDPGFSQSIASDLASRYRQLSELTDNPDVIFSGLIDYVQGGLRTDLKFFWAAAGIVAHYFELCDVFER